MKARHQRNEMLIIVKAARLANGNQVAMLSVFAYGDVLNQKLKKEKKKMPPKV